MKRKKIKITNIVSFALCAVSAAALLWFTLSVFTVRSARSIDNELPAWNYFAVIGELC
ncbi:MAG: hypothetical protein IJD95_02875 [Clostridia bacterium]|nr:hypothetical protein [Clostridia bacterium]MBR2327356.1 hypothetical protein [Clostridia bacterium]